MSPGDAIALTALTVGAAFSPMQILRLWRHTTTAYDRKPANVPWSDATWRGIVRALPVLCGAGVCLAIAGWLVELASHGPVMAAAATFFFLMLAGVILGVMIIFWNIPRFLVPPDRRHESGALSRR